MNSIALGRKNKKKQADKALITFSRYLRRL